MLAVAALAFLGISSIVEDPTSRFWAWFKNSVVRDEQGRPLVVFRGFRRIPTQIPWRTTRGRATLSFTPDPRVASVYALKLDTLRYGPGSSMVAAYLSIQRPLDLIPLGNQATLEEVVNELPFDFTQEVGTDDPPTMGWRDLCEWMSTLDWTAQHTGGKIEIEGGLWEPNSIGEIIEKIEKIGLSNRKSDEAKGSEIFYWLRKITLDIYLLGDNAEVVNELQRLGYDGILHEDVFEVGANYIEGEEPETVIALRPFSFEQIWNALGDPRPFTPP